MSGNTELINKVTSSVSNYTKDKLIEYSKKYTQPITNLIAMAIENELLKDKPFKYDVSNPDDEYIEHAYIEEAIRIIAYMKKSAGLSLENICLLRHDIGIPDKETLLLAFRECVLSGQLVAYKPKQGAYISFKYPDHVEFYRIKGIEKFAAKKLRKKATDYQRYQKLKKEFEGI